MLRISPVSCSKGTRINLVFLYLKCKLTDFQLTFLFTFLLLFLFRVDSLWLLKSWGSPSFPWCVLFSLSSARIRKRKRGRNTLNRSGNTTDNLCFRYRFRDVFSRFRCCVNDGTGPLFVHVSVKFQLKETNVSAIVIPCLRLRKHMETLRKHVFSMFPQENIVFKNISIRKQTPPANTFSDN